MPDAPTTCDRFDAVLLAAGSGGDEPAWEAHLASCDECRAQWRAHRLLTLAFAEEEVPELSAAFQEGLERKFSPMVEIRPLRGWRKMVMLAYSVGALGVVGWALRDLSLPTIDLSSPWVPIAVLMAVPLTFVLAIAISRWIPSRRLPGIVEALAL